MSRARSSTQEINSTSERWKRNKQLSSSKSSNSKQRRRHPLQSYRTSNRWYFRMLPPTKWLLLFQRTLLH